jgi:hypothetical protein
VGHSDRPLLEGVSVLGWSTGGGAGTGEVAAIGVGMSTGVGEWLLRLARTEIGARCSATTI